MRLDVCNATLPTAAINVALRADSIIVTGNAPTGNVTRRHA
jgi:hypothetical protein